MNLALAPPSFPLLSWSDDGHGDCCEGSRRETTARPFWVSALVKMFCYFNQLAPSSSKVCRPCSFSDEFLIFRARKFDCSVGKIPKSFDQMLRLTRGDRLDLVGL